MSVSAYNKTKKLVDCTTQASYNDVAYIVSFCRASDYGQIADVCNYDLFCPYNIGQYIGTGTFYESKKYHLSIILGKALEVIAEFTNTKQLKDINENYGQGGVIHMCKAWDDRKAEGEQRMADLISKLYTDGKMEIVPEIVTNLELRNQYYAQYSL